MAFAHSLYDFHRHFLTNRKNKKTPAKPYADVSSKSVFLILYELFYFL